VVSDNHFLPLIIDGKIQKTEIRIDCSSTSQVLTGLLIALPLYEHDSLIHVNGLKSKPYIDMTLQILKEFGIRIIHNEYRRFEIPGKQIPILKKYFIEGDWSSAAFHFVGGAIAGNVSVSGLKNNSVQADRIILQVLSDCGSIVNVDDHKINVKKGSIKSFCFDASDCPDLFPPLAVLAACAEGKSNIMGVSRLYNKESNRAETLKSEFEKLGVRIESDNDKMVIFGGKVHSGIVSSYNDHRIAMACAILGLKADGPVEIKNAECINKSYPDFFRDYGLLTKQ
jgi:3-phosphoshikimate 1-carboxyvinyltransferase